MPVGYEDDRKWTAWETQVTNGQFFVILALDNQNWYRQTQESKDQVGILKKDAGLRGFRVGAVGTLNFETPWVYTLFGQSNRYFEGYDPAEQDSFEWFDYRLDIPLSMNSAISIGKQKEPFSMEKLMPLVYAPMQERHVGNDALINSRNVGVVYSYAFTQQRISWAMGVFNDSFEGDFELGQSSTELTTRLTHVLFENESELLHLGGGLRHSTGKEGFRFDNTPEFYLSPLFVDTGQLGSGHINDAQLELAFRTGPWLVMAESIFTQVDEVSAMDNSFIQDKANFSSYSLTGSWIVTGEMRLYNERNGIFGRVPVSRSMKEAGWGSVELVTRLSNVDLTDDRVRGGDIDIFSLGANWWLTSDIALNLNVRWIDLKAPSQSTSQPVSGKSNGLNFRVFASF